MNTMAHNIDSQVVIDNTFNTNLAGEDVSVIEKYIKRAIALVSSHININQFDDGTGQIVFPEDMIVVVVSIIEYLYIDGGMFGSGRNSFKSEKIGDYSYTKKDTQTIGGLDLPANIMAMLDVYSYYAGSYNISIGGYDRPYSS